MSYRLRKLFSPARKTGDSARIEQARIFIPLVHDYVHGAISVNDFETRYLRLVKDTPGELDAHVGRAVDELFFDVDAFVADDNLRGHGDLDSDQLLESARRTLDELMRISSQ